MPDVARLEREIENILEEKFLAHPASPDDDLVNAGVVDSLTLIQLLVHLEERFAVSIPLDELDIEDIRSVRSLARLVASRGVALAAGVTS